MTKEKHLCNEIKPFLRTDAADREHEASAFIDRIAVAAEVRGKSELPFRADNDTRKH